MSNHWVADGWGYRISSVDELMRAISRIGTLQTGEQFVWRGVSNAQYKMQSSLQRALTQSRSYFTKGFRGSPGEGEMLYAERRVLLSARSWGLGTLQGNHLEDLQLLANLQHHGAPTRLLDFTEDPMTALWFACQPNSGTRDASGVLFAMNVTRLSRILSTDVPENSWGRIEDPLGWSLSQGLEESRKSRMPILVEPSAKDARMIAQQGLFLTGSTDHPSEVQGIEAFNFTPRGGPPTQSGLANLFSPGERSRGRPPFIDFCAIVIPPPVKGRMLRHLAGTYNKTEARIYPDLAGFSSALHRLSVELEGAPRRSRTVRQDLEEQQLRELQASPVWNELQRPLA